MLRSRLKLGLMMGLIVASVASAGCLRSTQEFTLYPDGSGCAKVKLTLMGMMAQAIKMGQMGGGMGGPGGGGPEGMPKDPIDMVKEMVKGNVYWTDLEAKDGEEGTFVLSGTAYFDNIADIELEKGNISFEKEGEGYKVSLHQEANIPGADGIPGMPGGDGDEEGMTEAEKAQAEQMKAMVKGMIAGFNMVMRVRMPGEVTEIDGFREHEGRQAWIQIDEAEITRMMDNNERPPEDMMVICGHEGDIADEFAQFQVELAAAKAAAASGGSQEEEKEEEKEEEEEGQF